MKITPVPAGGSPSTTPNTGQSASPDRIARAKAALTGQPIPEPVVQEAHQETTSEKIKRIRMNTNATPAGRDWNAPQAEPEPVAQEAHIPAEGEPASAASEEPKTLSPQFAALAKQRRALDVREKSIQAREEALKAGSQSTTDAKTFIERLNADPLGLLAEHGVDYNRLTQEVLKYAEGGGPALTKVETELRKEIKGLKEALDNQTKTQAEQWTQAQENALDEMQDQADQIIAESEDYQLIREAKANQDVKKLIKRIYDDEGKTLSVKAALDLLENDLLEEGLRYSKFKKVQERANPAPAPQAAPLAQSQDGVRRQTMRTLTNRDTVSTPMSRRDRMMAAALGKKI